MSKIQENKILSNIVFGLLILLILGVGAVALAPILAHAASGYYTDTNGSYEYVPNKFFYTDPNSSNYNNTDSNPTPHVSYLTPDSSAYKNSGIEVKVRGSDFIPSSRVRFDNISRPTNYVSSINLTVMLNSSDLVTPGIHTISVVNPGPGGGTSNLVYFTVDQSNNGSVLGTTTYRTPSSSSTYTTSPTPMVSEPETTQEFKNLTANTIYGSGNFMPSSFVQWIAVAILILVIVLLARKFFGLEKKYHSTPLKHS